MHLFTCRKMFVCACVVSAVLNTASCGSRSDRPEITTVTGRITINGQPLQGYIVNFKPTTGRPSVSSAPTDADGRYEMMYKLGLKGVKVDHHKVFLIFAPADDQSAMDADRGKLPADVKALVEKYGDSETTPLEVDVTPDRSTYDFDIQ